MTDPTDASGHLRGDHVFVQRAAAAEGSIVIQVAGNLYLSEKDLAVLWAAGETVPGECPYPGLGAFGPGQAKWFFGREKLTGDLLDMLDAPLHTGHGGPFIVVGASGAGKSSLLGAGLVKALRDGRLAAPGSDLWPILTVTPGTRPLETLTEAVSTCTDALADGAVGPSAPSRPWESVFADFREALRRSGTSDAPQRVIIVIDKFEEFFTPACGETERKAFLDALAAITASGPSGPVGLVILGIRADFYASATQYPALREALQSRQLVVGAMTLAEVTQAITYPARAAGLHLEPGLTERLLRDLGVGADGTGYEAGRLPLLGYALRATWQRRSGTRLTIAGYEAAGGIGGAIAKTAEEVFTRLAPLAQETARQLFLALVQVGSGEPGGEGTPDTRRRVSRARLCSIPANPDVAAAVLDAFTQARLITSSEQTAEIIHEALLSRWPRLRDWIGQDRAGHLIRQPLEEAAGAWDRAGRYSSADLYTGSRLAQAQAWADDSALSRDLSRRARDFLATSGRRQKHAIRRRNQIIAVLATLSLLFVSAALFAGIEDRIANQQRNTALQERGQAIYNQTIAEALQLGPVNASRAAQLELAAYRIQRTPDVTARLLNFENTPLPTPLTGLPAAVDVVAFSRDGHLLASGGSDGAVQLWDMSDPAHPQPVGPPLTVATGAVDSVAFSPRGPVLATGSGDGAVRLWDVSDPADVVPIGQPLAGSAGYVLSVSFSWNGRMLASGGSDGAVRLWNVTSPANPRPVGSPVSVSVGPVNSVAFSRDGRTLASGGSDGAVRLWNVANPVDTSALGRPLTGEGAAVASVAFSLDGRMLASGGSDGAVRLWNVANPGNPRPLGPPLTGSTGTVDSVAFSHDGRMLASGGSDGAVRLWDVANPAAPQPLVPPLTGPVDAVSSVVFTPDDRTLATGSTDRSIWLWNLPRTILIGHAAAADSVSFSPDGQMLASGSTDHTARLWDMTDPAAPKSLAPPLTGPTGTVDSVAFSPDNRMLATGSFDGTVRLWNAADPVHPHMLGSPLVDTGGDVLSLAFGRNGRTLAVGSSDHSVQLWDVTDPVNPRPLGQPLAANDTIAAVAFGPDGQVLASGSYDGTVRLWDVTDPARARPLGSLLTGSAGYVLTVAFSPNRRMLASGSNDGTVRLWNLTDPAHPRSFASPLTGPAGRVNSVAFSRDSRTLAVGSSDGTVRLWDVTDPAHPVSAGPPLTGSGAAVTSVAFSPDKPVLASASYDSTIRLWNLSVTYAAERICTVADNALTPDLWRTYIPQLPYQPPCAASPLRTPPSQSAPVTGSVPDAPSSVVATATGPRTITVTWAETSRDVTGYNVDNGCPVSPAGTCGGSDASLARTTGRTTSAEFAVTPGAYQCFRVQAFNKSRVSSWSGFGCAMTQPLTVTGKREWTDTGVNLTSGARLFIEATGLVYINSASPEGPAGSPACEPVISHPAASSGFPAPTLPCWSLVARIGNGPPFEVGSSTLIITTSGRLYLGINDNSSSNNSGSWTVLIKIGGPPPPFPP